MTKPKDKNQGSLPGAGNDPGLNPLPESEQGGISLASMLADNEGNAAILGSGPVAADGQDGPESQETDGGKPLLGAAQPDMASPVLSDEEAAAAVSLASSQDEDKGSGPMSLVKAVMFGNPDEQKPDKSLLESLRETREKAAHGESVGCKGGSEQGQIPGLFTAMDAPLNGLTPDDINFASEVDAALSRRPRFGARALSVAVAVMLVVLIIWAGFADIDEVTHAEGQVVGSQRTQTMQNLEGGILRAVLVREGQIVEKGTVLAQIDNEMAESSYRDAMNKTMENTLAISRLEAELKDEEPTYPEEIEAWVEKLVGNKPDANTVNRARQVVMDQQNAWRSRMNQLSAELDVLRSQQEQRRRDVDEQVARKTQLDRSLLLSIQQRDAAQALLARNNFSRMEFLGLQQKVVELQGQIDMLAASIPKAQAAADEAQRRIAQRKAEQHTAVTEEINKRRIELTSLHETLAAGSDRVTRTELRTPVRGTVKQIYLNTLGGVVKPGEPIMDIVPLDDTLLVEARVLPKDVAFLRPNQDVMVKVSAYDFSIYGGLEGKLESISADTIEDKRGDYYYLVKVRTRDTSITYHNEVLPIIPGMMVTTDIMIGKKTVLDYLLKPILKAKQNALRER